VRRIATVAPALLFAVAPALLTAAVLPLLPAALPPPPIPVETFRAVGGLPAHIAGRFEDLTICRQTSTGAFLVFDRRQHRVFNVPPAADAPTELVTIGAEPGRLLQPYAFDAGADGTFVVADVPASRGRVQVFLASGSRLAGFAMPSAGSPLLVDGVAVTGLASLVAGRSSVFLSQPESGSLIVERGFDGVSARAFGELRATGQEHDRPLHHALNSGFVVINPEGGFYYVFAAGVPAFRKYDERGALVFERHVEGVELDAYMRDRPTVWPRRKTESGEVPLVRPIVRAAVADGSGSLWLSLDVPFTYVYDRRGDKQRIVQFRATGALSPTNLSFTPSGRLLATPGCHLFDVRR
jgi:hypothetical protein